MAINPTEQIIIDVTQTVVLTPDNYLRRFAIVSNGDTNLDTGSAQEVTLSTMSDVFDTTTDDYKSTYTYCWLISFFTNNSKGTALVVEVKSSVEDDTTPITTAVSNLSDYILEASLMSYKYSVPNSFYNEPTFAALVQLYSGLTSQQYFSAEVNTTLIPSSDSVFISYNSARNFFAIYPSTIQSESVDGALTGIMASSTFYDLSSTTPLTPMVNKLVSGITPNDSLGSTLENDLIGNNVNYVRTVAGLIVECIGTYLGGTMWEYYYASDLLQYNLKNRLQETLINGANNPRAVIGYNKIGVQTLKSIIEDVIGTLILYGAVTDFGTGVDSNNDIEDSGSIYYIPYATYKSDNYSNYTQGIYDGFSFAIDIARFILQVKISIQLN